MIKATETHIFYTESIGGIKNSNQLARCGLPGQESEGHSSGLWLRSNGLAVRDGGAMERFSGGTKQCG